MAEKGGFYRKTTENCGVFAGMGRKNGREESEKTVREQGSLSGNRENGIVAGGKAPGEGAKGANVKKYFDNVTQSLDPGVSGSTWIV